MRQPVVQALTMAATGLALMGCQASGHAPAPTTRPAAERAYSHEAATALYRQGKYAEEEAMCRQEIARIEGSEGQHSAKLAGPLDDLAGAALRRGQFAEARGPIERAESVLDKTTPDGATEYARLCINKGWLAYSLGNVSAAEKVFEEGKTLLEKFHKEPTIDLAELINNIGLAYEDNDDDDAAKTAKARGLLLRGWEMRRKLTGEHSPESGESLNNIGMNMLFHSETQEGVAEAAKTLMKAMAISDEAYGKDNPETAVSHTNLAMAYHLTGEEDEAEKQIRIALPMTEKWLGKENPDRAYELQVLGQVEQAQEKYTEAEASFQEAVRLTEKTFGKDHRFVGSALEYLQSLYEASGKTAEAKEVQARIEKLRGRDI